MGDRPGAPEPLASPLPHPSIVSGDVEPTQDPVASSPPDEEHEHQDEGSGDWGFFREFGFLTLAALLIAIVIKTFLIQAFFIPSGSMEPTLMPNDRILVNRLAYRSATSNEATSSCSPIRPPRSRIAASWVLPPLAGRGDRCGPSRRRRLHQTGDRPPRRDVGDARRLTYVDGRKLDEPYVNQDDPDTRSFGPETVPDGMLFVMGDNRNHSGDSRFPPPSGLGYIPVDRVIGQAFVIIWPPSRAGWLH